MHQARPSPIRVHVLTREERIILFLNQRVSWDPNAVTIMRNLILFEDKKTNPGLITRGLHALNICGPKTDLKITHRNTNRPIWDVLTRVSGEELEATAGVGNNTKRVFLKKLDEMGLQFGMPDEHPLIQNAKKHRGNRA